MLTQTESWREFALALRYLAGLIGTDTPAQLRTIARALSKTRWELPVPDSVDDSGVVYGYSECICEYAMNELLPDEDEDTAAVRALLQPLPGNAPMKKMCYVNSIGKIIPGYELAAVKGPDCRAAIIGRSALNEGAAEELLRRGYSCLFVKKAVQTEAGQTDPDG
jgi:hypothetical protein